jgi:thiosulfate/3-mercaptopyruvate sulfurtransferase
MSYANPEYLIEPDALAAALDEGRVRVFDATVFLEPAERGYRARSGIEEYAQGHIPGAAFLDQLSHLSDTSSGLGFTLPEVGALQRALGAAGAGTDTPVVVYSSGHMMWATRAWWLLHYAGHDRVAVLNGGLAAWRGAGLPLATDTHEHAAASFEAEPRRHRFVGKDEVLGAIGSTSVCTVNALSPDVYTGEAAMSYGRKGHITGSVNLHYDELLDGGRYRPAAELERLLRAQGLLEAEQVYAYCGGGISATIDAFACLLVGKDDVAVYDGSMSEWVRDESLPMTTGAEAG